MTKQKIGNIILNITNSIVSPVKKVLIFSLYRDVFISLSCSIALTRTLFTCWIALLIREFWCFFVCFCFSFRHF